MNKKHIVFSDTGVSKKDRENKNGHKAVLIWLTGLPCAGKSTVARELQRALFKRGCQVFVLDGDNIRHGLSSDLGFSPDDRRENIRRIGEAAKLFTEAGFIAITAFISPYRKSRDKLRTLFSKNDFIEVYVKTDVSVCEKRDIKGLYKKARKGEIAGFTGISAPYEPPKGPELVLDTEKYNKEECVRQVLDYLRKHKVLR